MSDNRFIPTPPFVRLYEASCPNCHQVLHIPVTCEHCDKTIDALEAQVEQWRKASQSKDGYDAGWVGHQIAVGGDPLRRLREKEADMEVITADMKELRENSEETAAKLIEREFEYQRLEERNKRLEEVVNGIIDFPDDFDPMYTQEIKSFAEEALRDECEKCKNRMSMHRGDINMCCKCYVEEGGVPADWHRKCIEMAPAYRFKDGKAESPGQ